MASRASNIFVKFIIMITIITTWRQRSIKKKDNNYNTIGLYIY